MKPTLKELADMNSTQWYDVRKTQSVSGEMITARKKGVVGRRFFLAWSKEELMRDVHYGEECTE